MSTVVKLYSFSRVTILFRKATANPTAPDSPCPTALPASAEMATAVSVAAPDFVGGIPAADLSPVSLLLLQRQVCVQLIGKNFTCKRGKWAKFNHAVSTVQQEVLRCKIGYWKWKRILFWHRREVSSLYSVENASWVFTISETVGKRTLYNLFYGFDLFF